MNYEFETVKARLSKLGAKFNSAQKTIDMSRPHSKVGIGTLGLLDYMKKQGYKYTLPEVEYRKEKGYRGIYRP